MIEKCIFKFELSAFYSWACHMIAYTLNWLVNAQGKSISNLWWEIHKQIMAGNSTFLWFLCLTTKVIASFTSCVLCSIKRNLEICYICNSIYMYWFILRGSFIKPVPRILFCGIYWETLLGLSSRMRWITQIWVYSCVSLFLGTYIFGNYLGESVF